MALSTFKIVREHLNNVYKNSTRLYRYLKLQNHVYNMSYASRAGEAKKRKKSRDSKRALSESPPITAQSPQASKLLDVPPPRPEAAARRAARASRSPPVTKRQRLSDDRDADDRHKGSSPVAAKVTKRPHRQQNSPEEGGKRSGRREADRNGNEGGGGGSDGDRQGRSSRLLGSALEASVSEKGAGADNAAEHADDDRWGME